VTFNDRVLAWAKTHKWKAPWAAGGMIAAIVGVFLVAFNSPHGPNDCDLTPLRHVYSPQRLRIIEKCKTAKVTVISWRHEQDDDWHVNVRPDDGTLINGANIRSQHGLLVLEWVPGDRRPARFFCGQRLEVTGTFVSDQQHDGMNEIHPVMRYRALEPSGCTEATAGANLAPPTE
jgi:hypothetical protein